MAVAVALLVGVPNSIRAQDGKAAQTKSMHERGFVSDEQCAACHESIQEEFQSHGMARSFSSAANAIWVEDFDAPVVRDGRLRYQLKREQNRLVFAQWQVAADGLPIHVWQREVDWIVGSGSASRVYLAQTEDGTLYELPIAWYTQEAGWGIKPGAISFDGEAGVRMVRRGCLFCHNAMPFDPPIDDDRHANHVFPKNLPEGIGCQRCHGPGALHSQTARAWQQSVKSGLETGTRASTTERREARDSIRASIVNPKRLPPERRRDVCAQCHHQPAVAVFGKRRLGRGDFEFAAGDVLDEFLLKLEVQEFDLNGDPVPTEDRFDINHHAYRLERSACFLESPAGALECTSCHDAHHKPEKTVIHDRAREVCISCHQLPVPPGRAAEDAFGTAELPAGFEQHLAQPNCVECHMPRRRTQDVPNVVMTDHQIQRSPEPLKERLAFAEDVVRSAVEVRILDPESKHATPFDDLLKSTAMFKSGFGGPLEGFAQALVDAQRVFPEVDLSEPALVLAMEYLEANRLAEARDLLEPIAARVDESPAAHRASSKATVTLATVVARQGDIERAAALLNQKIASRPADLNSDLYYNRGLFNTALGRTGACQDFAKAVQMNDLQVRAWLYLGQCRAASGDKEGAVEAYSRVIAITPDLAPRALAPLLTMLEELGRSDQAQRIRRHQAEAQ